MRVTMEKAPNSFRHTRLLRIHSLFRTYRFTLRVVSVCPRMICGDIASDNNGTDGNVLRAFCLYCVADPGKDIYMRLSPLRINSVAEISCRQWRPLMGYVECVAFGLISLANRLPGCEAPLLYLSHELKTASLC